MATALSPLDESFLLLERTWAPMHFGGLSILGPRPQGPLGEAELRAAALARLRRLPRLRARAVFPWRGLRHAVWEPVRLDPEHHVRSHRLPEPGGRPELLALAGLLHAAPLDHRRPLWELHLIDGLEDGRQATLLKLHHAVADGIGGMDVADAFFDPGGAPARRHAAGPPPADPGRLEPLQLLEGTVRFLAGGLTTPLPLFTREVGPRRALGFARVAAGDLLAAKRRLGGTVDDVLLEVVAAALTRHLAASSNHLPAEVRAMVPMSLRGLEGGAEGNHVTAMFVELPLGEPPEAFVGHVAGRKELLRQEHEGQALAGLVRLSGLLPSPLQSVAVRLATRPPSFNLVISDIPGPAAPYRLLGAPVEAMYPLMPLHPSVGVSVAAVWAGGVVGIGVTADPAQLPDPSLLAALIEAEARELGRAALRARRPRPPAAARRAPRSPRSCAPRSRGAAASASASAPPPPR